MSALFYTTPSHGDWNRALPIGNGKLGAMIFGEGTGEHFQLNEDSVWFGQKRNRNNPDALANLDTIRRYIFEGKIEKAEERLENLKADREALRQLPIDEETKLPVFKITIAGTEYTDRKEAAQALEDTVLDFVKKSSDSEKEIGEFQGFKLSVKAVMFGNEPDISITMKGNAEHSCTLTSSFSANLKRIESTLYKIDQTISDAQNNVNKLKMDLENAQRIVNTPFPQQAELEEKTERLTALTEELNQAAMEAKKNAPEKQRTCYFERAKLKKEAFKDRQKTTKPKERSQDKNEIE